MAINKVDFSSVSSNNTNTSKISDKKNAIAIARKISDRKNAVTIKSNIKNEEVGESKKSINSVIRNEKMKKPNKDAKVGLKV